MILDLLIASGNAGKVREFRQMLGGERFAWRDLSDLPRLRDGRGNRPDLSAKRVPEGL